MTERQTTNPARRARAAATNPESRNPGRAGPSPLLRSCRECGRDLPKAVSTLFAVCGRCSVKRPGAVLGGEGGLPLSFGRATGFGPLRHPSDGAYGLDEDDTPCSELSRVPYRTEGLRSILQLAAPKESEAA